MGYRGLRSTKHGLHSQSMGYTAKVWATEGYTSTKHGLHRQSMGYTVPSLSMGYMYRGLHSTKHGLHRQSMGYRGLHSTIKAWATQYKAWATQPKYGLQRATQVLSMGYIGKVWATQYQV